MQRSTLDLSLRLLVIASLTALLVGCGGAGGGSPESGGDNEPPPVAEQRQGTAVFRVDVNSGQVKVTNLEPSSRAVFAGSAVQFQSTTLIDQPGNTGRKVLRVALKNNTNEAIGGPEGVRVDFMEFRNFDTSAGARALTNTSHVAGSGASGMADGSLSSAQFYSPTGVAMAPDGSMIVADSNNNRIRKIASAGVFTIAGTGAAGTIDGPAGIATFNKPYGVAVAADGTIYVCELLSNKIRRISTSGVVSTVAGTGAIGSQDGAGDVSSFGKPEGIAIGSDGTLYVSDTANCLIRKISPALGNPALASSYMVSTLAGSVSGFADGIGTSAKFKNPRGLAVDDRGYVYVADRLNYRIRRIGQGGEVMTISGAGSTYFQDGSTLGTFVQPGGIAVMGENALIVADTGANAIRQVVLTPGGVESNRSSWMITTLAGGPASGDSVGTGLQAAFFSPQAVVFDRDRVLIADSSNHRVKELTSVTGLPVNSVGVGAGTEPVRLFNADGFVPKSGQGPLDGQPPFKLIAGSIPSGGTSGASEWQFIVPGEVSVFEFTVMVHGNTEFPTTYDGVVNTSNLGSAAGSAQNYVRTFTGVFEENNWGVNTSRNGPPHIAKFNIPTGIAADAAGNIYVADFPSLIRRVTPDGHVSTIAGSASDSGPSDVDGPGDVARVNTPHGIACDPDGKAVYFTTLGKVRMMVLEGTDPSDPKHWTVSTIAGSGTTGDVDGRGDVAQIDTAGLVRTSGGNLIITATNRLRKIVFDGSDRKNPAHWVVSHHSGSSSGVEGYADSTYSTQVRFKWLRYITIDKEDNVYLRDYHAALRKVDPSGGSRTIMGYGGIGSVPVDGPASQALLHDYDGPLAIDSAGYIYIATGGKRIRRISPSGFATSIAGKNAAASTSDAPGNLPSFRNLWSLCVLPDGKLIVGDDQRLRVVERIIKG